NVLLPAVFAPMTQTNSPGRRCRDTESSTSRLPYPALTPLSSKRFPALVLGSASIFTPQISFDDFRMARDHCRFAIRDQAAKIQDQYPVAHRHDCAHMMLDDHHRQPIIAKF